MTKIIGAILAGGFGKRLKPITDEIPKVLVEIRDNYTIMDRQLTDFRNSGIEEVYVLSGHLGDKIEQRYGKEKDGMKFHYLREEKPMGTLYSIRSLLNEVKENDIILRNGDTVSDVNYDSFIDFALNSPSGMTMLVTKMRSPYGIVNLLGDTVMNFTEKPQLDHYINSGLYFIRQSIRDYFFNQYNGKDIETTVFPVLAKKKEISAFRDDSLWIGVDSEKELEQVRSEYKGRTDMPYGYNRKIYDHGDASLLEYLIRGGKKAIIENGKVVRIISGNGIIASGTNTNYSAGAVLERKGTMEFQSLTDTRLELLSY
ncbi:MAG: nucleotidyltransferase family protein [Candidatus Thermoplasmatota archaeon]|nr:nucleotidyltransferase family protein [Candidatus Thermoplasmatota archaeon]